MAAMFALISITPSDIKFTEESFEKYMRVMLGEYEHFDKLTELE
jgi:hypothetical protein